MFKILFFLLFLFLVITLYSFKKKIDNVIDTLFPPKHRKRGTVIEPEELVRCANCGVYLSKYDAVKKIKLNGDVIYFCSKKCKDEYYKKR